MAEKKPSNREQIKQIVAGIEDNIQQIFQSERYMDYLRTMSRFHTYSVNNTILIHMQMPNATHVAGFNKWKNQFGRHVKKGEKGLTVIAPTPFKKKIEEMKLDPETRAPVLDGEGKVVMEEREIEIPLFKPVKVFDVSQTEGRPLPSLSADLTGNVQHYEAFMEALRRTSPMPINMGPLGPDTDGLCNLTKQTITIREDMSQVQTVCATVHEITHAVLHDREHTRLTSAAGDGTKELPKPKDNNTMEVEAESVSYTVCQYYGIETGANSLGYIATWSKDRSLPELKASLETISKTASALITSIDRHFAEICKEQGIDLTAQQPEQAVVEAPMESLVKETLPAPELPDTPEQFMDDMMDLMDRLYQAGLINRNFPPDNREQIKAEQVRTLRVNPSLARAVLEKFVREDTGAAEAKELLQRLDSLIQSGKQALSENEYVYKVEANASFVGPHDSFYVQAYEKTPEGTLKPDEVIFISSYEQCCQLLNELENGTMQRNDFFLVRAAGVSRYTTKDGAELDALVDPEGKVYLGRRDHYDNRGHYMNHDKTLLHISNNEKMFDLITGSGYTSAQAGMLDGGFFTQEDFAEYDALRVGVLAQFNQTSELLFAGKPFQLTQPEPPEIPHADRQEDAALWDTTLDKYPLPNVSLTLDDLVDGSDLLPLSREQAAAFLEQDMTVYMVEAGKDPAMVFDQDDLMEQPEGMMFAVPREEWEGSQDFRRAVLDRMQHQEEREQAFLDHGADCFAIYQVIFDDERRFIAFSPLERLHSDGYTVDRGNYELAYTAPLPEAPSINAALETLWEKFNLHHPADYQRPSMSVSDIVAIKRDGVVSCHYCDSVGFVEMPDFLKQKPTVAELEDQVKTDSKYRSWIWPMLSTGKRNRKNLWCPSSRSSPSRGGKKQRPKRARKRGFDMETFTFEETNLLCIYNGTGTRTGVIAALTEMRGYLEPDENELRELTDSALSKLGRMSDADFAALELFPDFEAEDPANGE